MSCFGKWFKNVKYVYFLFDLLCILIFCEYVNKIHIFQSVKVLLCNLIITFPDSFEWIETHLVSTIDAQTGHLKVLWCYRNIEKQKQFELSQREQTAWIAQLSEEYYAVYLVNLSNNTLRGLRVPEQFKKIVHMEECYDKQFSMYVNEFVDPKWQQTLFN